MQSTPKSIHARPKIGRPPAPPARTPLASRLNLSARRLQAARRGSRANRFDLRFIAAFCALVLCVSWVLGRVMGPSLADAEANAVPLVRYDLTGGDGLMAETSGKGAQRAVRASSENGELIGRLTMLSQGEPTVSYSAGGGAIDKEDRKRLLSILSKD